MFAPYVKSGCDIVASQKKHKPEITEPDKDPTAPSCKRTSNARTTLTPAEAGKMPVSIVLMKVGSTIL